MIKNTKKIKMRNDAYTIREGDLVRVEVKFITDCEPLNIEVKRGITGVVSKIYNAKNKYPVKLMRIVGEDPRNNWGKFRPYGFVELGIYARKDGTLFAYDVGISLEDDESQSYKKRLGVIK